MLHGDDVNTCVHVLLRPVVAVFLNTLPIVANGNLPRVWDQVRGVCAYAL